MPELAMCQKKDCPDKNICYRYRAVPCEEQSYGDFNPPRECEDYLPLLEDDKLQPVETPNEG